MSYQVQGRYGLSDFEPSRVWILTALKRPCTICIDCLIYVLLSKIYKIIVAQVVVDLHQEHEVAGSNLAFTRHFCKCFYTNKFTRCSLFGKTVSFFISRS